MKNIKSLNPLDKWLPVYKVNQTIIRVIIPIPISLTGIGYLGTKILAAPSILSNNNISIHSDNANNNLKDSNNIRTNS